MAAACRGGSGDINAMRLSPSRRPYLPGLRQNGQGGFFVYVHRVSQPRLLAVGATHELSEIGVPDRDPSGRPLPQRESMGFRVRWGMC